MKKINLLVKWMQKSRLSGYNARRNTFGFGPAALSLRPIAAVIAFSLLLACAAPAVSATGSGNYPHYFAAALREFMNSAKGKTKAALFDLDGDGAAEMIVFDEGVADIYEHWAVAAIGGRIAVYGIKGGNGVSSSITPYEYGHKVYQLFVTNKRYLVLCDIFEGTYYEVFKYENGVLEEKAYLLESTATNDNYYEVNGIECSFQQYKDKLSEYGINNIENYSFGQEDAAIVVGYGDMMAEWRGNLPAPADDVDKILAMTSDTEIRLPAIDGGAAPPAQPGNNGNQDGQAPGDGAEQPPDGNEGTPPATTAPTPPTTGTAAPLSAAPTEFPVYVNGQLIQFDAYLINDNNYFKLRDLAFTFSSTEKQFEVQFSSVNNAILLTSGISYTAIGGEMAGKGAGVKSAVPTRQVILLNGVEVQFTAYNIDGYNYFKLRDIGETFNFGVDWDATARVVTVDTSKIYTPD